MRQGSALSIITAIIFFVSFTTFGDLIAHWPLDGNPDDVSGYDLHATVHGDPVWTSDGYVGGAIELDGVDDYLNISGYPGITGSAGRTCMAWIKTTTGGDILGWGNNLGMGTKWRFTVLSNGLLAIQVQGYAQTTSASVNDGNWHHVAVVLPEKSAPVINDLELYIDGNRITDITTAAGTELIDTGSDDTVKIGVFEYAGTGLDYFEGLIDDVKIFDRALSSEEIADMFGPALGVSKNTLEFFIIETNSDPDAQLLTIANSGGGVLNWSADLTNKPDWLTVTPVSGGVGYNENEGVTVSVNTTDLPEGQYSYSFQVDAEGAFGSPQTITINLRFIDIRVPEDYPMIQAAIDAATEGDTIGVSPGTYFEHITLKNGVTLIGAGDNTIIDGLISPISYVISSYECDSSTLLEGFVITSSADGEIGIGMYNNQSSPTVRNCTFSGNTAFRDGGGMYNYISSPIITNCTFCGNTASRGGGGMYNDLSSPIIKDCTFSNNTATYGGGIYNNASRPIITNCIFKGNIADYGGGIYNPQGGSTVVTYSDGGDLTLLNCKFVNNVAESSWEGPVVDSASTIGKGGALYLSWGSCKMVNCTLAGNRAYEAGGGLWLRGYDIQASLINCILWGNTANYSGNEIGYEYYDDWNYYYEGRDSNLALIRNCDIAGCGGSGAGWNASMGIDGGGNIDSDPLFKGIGGAFQLDGVDDYVEIPSYTGISGGASRTCCAWVKTTSHQVSPILSWGRPEEGRRWIFTVSDSGDLVVGIGHRAKAASATLNDGDWHHVAAVLDDDGSPNVNEVKLYIDGIITTGTGGDLLVETSSDSEVLIGTILEQTAFFDGLIDDVRIYSRTLSQSEIQQVMDNDNAPVTDLEAHWKLDGNTDDASGNNRHGVLYGGPVWATEDSIDVANLDGVDDYVEIPSYTGISGGASRTCCAWIKTTSQQASPILSWGRPDEGRRWIFTVSDSGDLAVGIGYRASVSPATLNDGNWHHVAAVLDDDGSPNVNEIKLYIDGIITAGTSGDLLVETSSESEVLIGTILEKTAYFDGLIKEVRIYSRTLSQSEIQRVMNNDNAPATQLEAYWKLDGNTDDASGNNRHGVLYGGPAWTAEDPIDKDDDLRLKPSSPCINTGDKASLPTELLADLDGNPRIAGGQVDMGAYEFYNIPPIAEAGDDWAAYAWVDGLAEVQLNGTASYDGDGDVLEYYWYNDVNELIATGAEPNVLFGVGEYEITLIVNDGIEDSQPDTCIITVIEPIETTARMLPGVINRKAGRPELTGRIEFAGTEMPVLDPNEPMLLLVGQAQIEAQSQKLLYNEEELTWYLVGSFDSAAVIENLVSGTEAEMTLASQLESRQWVYGMDVVRVK